MDTLWQFDIQAFDFLSSQTFIAEQDGFIETLLGFGNRLWYHWYGTDGKIYMRATSFSRELHVINNPNESGTACNFQQPSVYFLTFNNGKTSNYINIELLEVPSSKCDSLNVGGNEL